MFLAHFGPFFSILTQKKFSLRKSGSVTHNFIYGFLAPCQISEKTYDTTTTKCLDRWPDGRTEGRTDSIL